MTKVNLLTAAGGVVGYDTDAQAGEMPKAPAGGGLYLGTDNKWTLVGDWAKTGVPGNQVQSDWNQSDNSKPDYIKNKPAATAQVQSDWTQTDNSKVDFIKNKPTIPAAQIQSDWAQATTTALDYIKNKPTIPAAQVNSDWNASSGVAQILNKPTIPAAQIQSDWNQATDTAVDFIKNKPTIPPAYTLPAANQTTIGGVKQTPVIPDLAGDADAATITAKVNALLAALRTAGIVAAS